MVFYKTEDEASVYLENLMASLQKTKIEEARHTYIRCFHGECNMTAQWQS